MDTASGTDPYIAVCVAAHRRLFNTVVTVTDQVARRPSLLPGWTVGHVLTHIARNADGHTLRLEGALRGEEIARYPGGGAQRDADIEAGAQRSAVELIADVVDSANRLEQIWQLSVESGWPNSHLLAGDHFTADQSPVRRLREVEVHHSDLGLAFTPRDWSDEYVRWEMQTSLERLPERLGGPEAKRDFLAWLVGRQELPQGLKLGDW